MIGSGRVLRIVLVVVGVAVLVVVAFWAIAGATTDAATELYRVEAADVAGLDMDSQAGDISVVVEDGDDIVVRSRRTSSLWNDASSDVTVAGATLSVSSGCDRAVLFADCEVDHDVAVPPDALANLTVDATAGSISVRGFGGEVEISTTAGRVTLLDFTGPTATLRSTAGQIVVDAARPPQELDVSTTAGEIDITVPDEPYRVSTETTAGAVDVDVRQDPDGDRSISARTTAGTIDISRR